jgi:hypothetical protein
MKLTAHLYPVPRLRMSGSISPLFQVPSWHAVSPFTGKQVHGMLVEMKYIPNLCPNVSTYGGYDSDVFILHTFCVLNCKYYDKCVICRNVTCLE